MMHLRTLSSLPFIFLASAASAQIVPWTHVMLPGDTVESLGDDFTFTGYANNPMINADGDIGFEGLFEGPGVTARNGRAIFAGVRGDLDMLIRSEDALPGGKVGELYDSHASLTFSTDRRIIGGIFISGKGVNGSNDRGVLFGARDDFSLVARTGTVPQGGSLPFRNLPYRSVLGAGERFTLMGDYDTRSTMRSIWGGDSGGMSEIAATGSSAPGFGPDDIFARGFSLPSMSAGGTVAFRASVEGPDIGTVPSLFRGDANELSLVAFRGQRLPGFVGNDTFREFGGGPSINNLDHLAFAARIRVEAIDQPSIWRAGDDGVPRPVFLGTEQLPGTPDGSTSRFTHTVTNNDRGSIAFAAELFLGGEVTQENDTGLYLWLDGEIRSVYREGTLIDPDKDVVIGTPRIVSRLTEQDRLAFQADVLGPGIDGRGLFAWDPEGGLMTVAYEGQEVQLASDDFRTIKFIDFAGSFANGDNSSLPGGTGGSSIGLNDQGLMAFGIRFEDGSSGVYTLRVPSPGSLMVVFGGCAFLASRRRR